jgi:hypothetical protein
MFGIKGKLVPRYIGPFLVLVRLGNMAYHFELLPALAGMYNVPCLPVEEVLKAVVDVVVNDVASIDVDLSYPEHPVKVLGQ